MTIEQLTNVIINYVKNNLTELDKNADNPYMIDESDKTIITTPSVSVRIEDDGEIIKVVVHTGKYANTPRTALHMTILSDIDSISTIESAIDNCCSNLFTNFNSDRYCDDNSRSIDDLIDIINNDNVTDLMKHRRKDYIQKRVKDNEQHIRALIKVIGWYLHRLEYDPDNRALSKAKPIINTIAHDPYAEHFVYDISQDVDDNVYGYKVQSIAKLLKLTADSSGNYSFNMRYNGTRVVDNAEKILNQLAEDKNQESNSYTIRRKPTLKN